MQQHPVFLRNVGDKTIITTIVDTKDLGLPLKDDMFMIANTGSSIYTNNNPTITLDKNSLLTSKEYLEAAGEKETYVKGNSIAGVLTSPIWWIRKSEKPHYRTSTQW